MKFIFLGLIMEPERRYTQTVKRSFHISNAALDITSADDAPTQVMCAFEKRNYLLCTLQKDSIIQVPLDLNFEVILFSKVLSDYLMNFILFPGWRRNFTFNKWWISCALDWLYYRRHVRQT